MYRFLVLFLFIGFMACNNAPKGEQAEVTEVATEAPVETAASVDGDVYKVDVAASELAYEGSKPTGKHHGTVAFKSGDVVVKDGNIVGGSVVFDLNTINDVSVTGEYKQKLEGHLKSPDFFDVEKYPEAKFEFVSFDKKENSTDGTTHTLTGNMTIKDVTKQLTFDVMVTPDGDNIVVAAPQFVFDRTDFGLKYKSKKFFSDLADKFINDEIGISFKMVAGK
ncbi:MAG: YceI family protein [Saprospiraceae bacterium]